MTQSPMTQSPKTQSDKTQSAVTQSSAGCPIALLRCPGVSVGRIVSATLLGVLALAAPAGAGTPTSCESLISFAFPNTTINSAVSQPGGELSSQPYSVTSMLSVCGDAATAARWVVMAEVPGASEVRIAAGSTATTNVTVNQRRLI